MKSFLLSILVIFLLTGCVSKKRYTEFVFQKYTMESSKVKIKKSEYITVNTSKLEQLNTLCKISMLKSFFVPALIYWQWNTTLKCELNPAMEAERFSSHMITYADSIGLQQKLNGQRLEINLESIPNSFLYMHKGFLFVPVVGYIMRDTEGIFPFKEELSFSYKLFSGDTETKRGIVTIPYHPDGLKNPFGTAKKFAWYYIDQHEGGIKRLGQDSIDKIIENL